MKLSERLAGLRVERNLKLRELREQIETATGEVIAMSYLSSLEKADRTPSIDTLTKIAAGYGMSLRELLAPVDLPKEMEPTFSESFEQFAAERKLTDEEKEELWSIQYRGKRPDTSKEWAMLYAVLDSFDAKR